MLLALSVTVFGQSVVPAASSGPKDSFTQRITGYAAQRHFNGTILVQQHGKRIYNKSFGLANFQYDVANTNQTKYKIASITKLFTSVLIMQLKDREKIDLDQNISTYLPGYKGEGGDKVKIFNLLTATSGIESNEKDAVNDDDIPAMYVKPYTTDQLLNLFCSGKLENPPGKVWNYNNADYVILGKIIEAIYKKPYEAVLKEQILDPLHMEHTGMFNMLEVIKDLAAVYMINDHTKAIENNPPLYTENYYAAGGLYSTADDLLKFANALYGNKLISSSSLAAILKPYLAGYGFGIWVSETTVNHKKITLDDRQGAIWGTRTRLERILEEDITIVLLTNVQTANIDDMQSEIIKALVK